MNQPPVHQTEKAPTNSEEFILGVERRLLERFLTLIRDNYKKADKAHFFLQRRAHTTNVYGLANLRDVLSHLAAIMDEKVTNKEAQLANAEEHLRRAILEPYETALNNFLDKFNDLYEKYRERVIPIKAKYPELKDAPSIETIDQKIREIDELSLKGKAAKRLNFIQPEWEDGIEGFVDAYDLLTGLYKEIEIYYNKLMQLERDAEHAATSKKLHQTQSIMKFLIALVIILVLIGIVWITDIFHFSLPR